METNKKAGRYQRILTQLETLLSKSEDPIAHMATISAVLYHKMDYFFWCGFYRLSEEKLTVAPYQGPLACQHLPINTGVCWAAINNKQTLIVADVDKFPGHIACDSRSKSEIVVPVKNNKEEIIAVLDIDSKELNSFDQTDAHYLEQIVQLIKL